MAERRRAPAIWTALALLAASPGAGAAQSLDLTPDRPRALLGDEITLTLRVQLRPGQELLDLTPRNILPPPAGVRVLEIDSLRPVGEGEFSGRVRMAFFRVGPQPIPTFSVLFRPRSGALPDTLVHAPVAMEIGSLLPAGNPALKDIRPLQVIGGPAWGPAVLLGVLTALGFAYLWVRGRRHARTPRDAAPPPPLDAGPFDRAMRQLAALEQQAIASGNGALPLYADVAGVLRRCLLDSGALRHEGLTTQEAVSHLPPPLCLDDSGERLHLLLADADLVKFARVRPDLPAALAHLERARQLLAAWKQATAAAGEPRP